MPQMPSPALQMPPLLEDHAEPTQMVVVVVVVAAQLPLMPLLLAA